MLSEIYLARSGMFSVCSSVHWLKCFRNSSVGTSFRQNEHSIELQFLTTFLMSFRDEYFSSKTRYFSYIFCRVKLMFLFACKSSSFVYSSFDKTDLWKAISKASWSFLFSAMEFFRNATWFSRYDFSNSQSSALTSPSNFWACFCVSLFSLMTSSSLFLNLAFSCFSSSFSSSYDLIFSSSSFKLKLSYSSSRVFLIASLFSFIASSNFFFNFTF